MCTDATRVAGTAACADASLSAAVWDSPCQAQGLRCPCCKWRYSRYLHGLRVRMVYSLRKLYVACFYSVLCNKEDILPPTLEMRAHSNSPDLLPTTVDRATPSPAPPRGHGIGALSPAVWPAPPVWCIFISVGVGGGPTGTAGEVLPRPQSAVAPAEPPDPLPRRRRTQPRRLRPWGTWEVANGRGSRLRHPAGWCLPQDR